MNIITFHKESKETSENMDEGGKKIIKIAVENQRKSVENACVENLIFNTINRGRVAVFIDGSGLFNTALKLGIEIDYAKLLYCLTQGARLLRAFFYYGVDVSRQIPKHPRNNERQQGFLFWMRRHGYRVVTKDMLPSSDIFKKNNLNVEIAVDMINLSPYYDTAVLVSGDGNLAYAVNTVTSKGAKVELVSLRAMTSESLINVADTFVDIDVIKQYIQKD
jgi:uncharacterized LabA/DUF88 family protein